MRRENRCPIVIDSGGCKIVGVLHLPVGVERAPAVMVSHGYAGSKTGAGRCYVQLAEALAGAGIATLRFDFRGCGDSEGWFDSVTVDQLIDDAVAVREFLGCHEAVDGERIGMVGVSLGGAITTYAAERVGGVKALALWAPMIDGTMWERDWAATYPKEVMENHIKCGGVVTSREFRDQFLRIRVDRVLGRMDIPFLHCYGGEDKVVFPGQRDAVMAARGDGKFLFFPETNHHFSHVEERRQMVAETTQFFKEHFSCH